MTSCKKDSPSNYNPYTISEIEEELTAEEIEILHAQQIIEGTSVLPELMKITIRAMVDFMEQDSLVGNVATVRTGCPCVTYVPDLLTGGGRLTLLFDDGAGDCETPGVGSMPKTYSGTIAFTFDNPISVENNTFTMSPITNFMIENYSITTSTDWDFTWEPLPRFFFGGFQSPLVVTNNDDNNITTYEMNPNIMDDEVILARYLGAIPSDPSGLVDKRYEFMTFNFTEFDPSPIKVTCSSSTTELTEEYLLGIGDRTSAGNNGNTYPSSNGDIDPIVIDPADCGCYINGSMWVAPFENNPTFTEYNWGYNANSNSVPNQCDEYYLRRAFTNDPNQTLLTSNICTQ